MPQPTHRQLRRFCEIDGWEETKSARGKTPDHYRYRKVLGDGQILRTKVSHGSGSIEDPRMWARIWKEQLGLTSEQQFWEALQSGEAAARHDVASTAEPEHVPRELFWQLVHRVGLTEREAAALSKEEAVQRMSDFWLSGG